MKHLTTIFLVIFFSSPVILLNTGCNSVSTGNGGNNTNGPVANCAVVNHQVQYGNLQQFMLDSLTGSDHQLDGGVMLKSKLINTLNQIQGDTIWFLTGRNADSSQHAYIFITERSAGNPFPVEFGPQDTTVCKCKIPKPCCPQNGTKVNIHVAD